MLGCILALMTVLTMSTSCSKPRDQVCSNDSVFVYQQMDDYMNPIFENSAEFLEYHASEVERISIDEAFCSMPEEVLQNVTEVLIKREGKISKKAAVMEYRANGQIYDNLPSRNNADTSSPTITTDVKGENDVDLGATDLGNRQESTSESEKTNTEMP